MAKITAEQRARIVAVAGARSDRMGVPAMRAATGLKGCRWLVDGDIVVFIPFSVLGFYMSLIQRRSLRLTRLPLGRWLMTVVALAVVVAPAALAAGDSYTPIPRVEDVAPADRVRPTDSAAIMQAQLRAEREAGERKQRRGTAAERAARTRSQSAFRGRGRASALQVARTAFASLMDVPAWTPPQLARDEQIVGYAGDHLIRIKREGKKAGAAIYSPFPTRARDAQGKLSPVDLSLDQSQDRFVTKNALIDVRLPKDLADGVKLGDMGATVRPPVSESASTGVEQAGKVFWSDVATDTDFMVAPVPHGMETFHILRSADAPEELPLLLDLPAGASLRYTPVRKSMTLGADPQAHSAGVQVIRDGEVIGTISPPVASDADGERVDIRLRIGDERVTLEVAHRDADVKYPLTVDVGVQLPAGVRPAGVLVASRRGP